MKIPSGTTNRNVYFVGVDATDLKTRETGLTGFTVVASKDGAADVTFTTPTISEIDAVSMPGVYSLLLDEQTTLTAGNDVEELCLHITASGMAPVSRTIELYRLKNTEGQALNDFNPATDTVANVTLVATTTAVSNAVVTDAASRTASKADVSGLATSTDISALNDFDPASETVAHVTLVDTTTNLTNKSTSDIHFGG